MSLSKKNITEIVENDLCIGCGTCVSVCPTTALSMVIDNNKGLYIPKIVEENCNFCGLCYAACPGEDVNLGYLSQTVFGSSDRDKMLGHVISSYIGFASDKSIRQHGSSGGLLSAFLIYLINSNFIDGALVTRMNPDRVFETQPFIARTPTEILEAAKSKYCPVAANLSLQEIMKKKGRYAVVGLPCHIHGIRKAQQLYPFLRKRIVCVCGLDCAGTRSYVGTDLVLEKYGIDKKQVTKLDYRGSNGADSWVPRLIVTLSTGESVIINGYHSMQEFHVKTPYRCQVCLDHANELADISFGDAWMPEFEGNPNGVSKAITRNNIADTLLHNAVRSGEIAVANIGHDKIKEPSCLINVKGKFWRKKRSLKAMLNLVQWDGRAVPKYHQKLQKPFLRDYYYAFKEIGRLYGYRSFFLKTIYRTFSLTRKAIRFFFPVKNI